MLALGPLTLGLHHGAPLKRKDVVRGALVNGLGGLLASQASSSSAAGLPWDRQGPLQAKWLEQVRIFLQDEADNVQYDGELAPGGVPAGPPFLSLVPIVQMQRTLEKSREAVPDPKQWPALIAVLSTGSFATIEFKRIFNQFSDNIYYASDTPEANAYLLGGATPSSKQTTQYLLRNEALKQVAEVVDELKYQSKQQAEGAEVDSSVALEYLDNALKVFRECAAHPSPSPPRWPATISSTARWSSYASHDHVRG